MKNKTHKMKQVEVMKYGAPVILADGCFPQREAVLEYLHQAPLIIACDGATQKLLDYGLEPTHIVGDLDSLSPDLNEKYKAIISPSTDQETNDFTKAVAKAVALGLQEVVVLGATGEREDHTLGNIGLLAEHASKLSLQMISDYGCFIPLLQSAEIMAEVGQQVSIFNPIGHAAITTKHLKYPITNRVLTNWWQGSLNEALSNSFELHFDEGVLVLYLAQSFAL